MFFDNEQYKYRDYLKEFKKNPSQENIDNLARWLERYCPESWTGEHLRIGDRDADGFLKPIYEENEDGELEQSGHWEVE